MYTAFKKCFQNIKIKEKTRPTNKKKDIHKLLLPSIGNIWELQVIIIHITG